MENSRYFVDTKKVAKQAQEIGEFMMMKCKSGNLLITGQFVLSLTAEQFFSIRCKLEIPKLETWYMKIKKELARSERKPGLEEWERRYNDWLNEADPEKKLANTHIELLGCNIYTDGFTYTAIKQDRLAMLQYSEDLTTAGRMVVIDGTHILAPMQEGVWRKNNWLKTLPGMSIEREAEDEK